MQEVHCHPHMHQICRKFKSSVPGGMLLMPHIIPAYLPQCSPTRREKTRSTSSWRAVLRTDAPWGLPIPLIRHPCKPCSFLSQRQTVPTFCPGLSGSREEKKKDKQFRWKMGDGEGIPPQVSSNRNRVLSWLGAPPESAMLVTALPILTLTLSTSIVHAITSSSGER